MKLYEMKMAPNPRRVRMFLAEKGIEIETIEVDIPSGQNLTPEFLSMNPRGVLPTLLLDDGTVLDESVAICRYIEELHPEPALFGSTALERAQIEQWQRIVENDGLINVASVFRNTAPHFKDHAVPGRGPATPQIPELAERGRIMLPVFYEAMNKRLGEVPYVAGESFSIADISLFVLVGFSRWIKLSPGEEYEHLAHWYSGVAARPSAKA